MIDLDYQHAARAHFRQLHKTRAERRAVKAEDAWVIASYIGMRACEKTADELTEHYAGRVARAYALGLQRGSRVTA
jgi:hypothetical protein